MIKKIGFVLLIMMLTALVSGYWWISTLKSEAKKKVAIAINNQKEKITEVMQYAQKNGYSDKVACFVDFSIPSFEPRFYLVNLMDTSVISEGLVAHGQASDYKTHFDKVVFSNKEGSYCSSKGYYKIGEKYTGKWGTAYRLHGLEESNSNALKRAVVLHAHDCVPTKTSNFYICLSQGCPTLNIDYFKTIQPIIDKQSKPALLYVYKSE
jgi:hypothetical protein